MTEDKTPVPQLAVWYFVAATFVFSGSVFVLQTDSVWLQILLFVVGLVLIVLGGIQLAREIAERRRRADPTPPE